jgi:hypothetical protein
VITEIFTTFALLGTEIFCPDAVPREAFMALAAISTGGKRLPR